MKRNILAEVALAVSTGILVFNILVLIWIIVK